MMDWSNIPLPATTKDRDGDVTTVHALVGDKLICSYVNGHSGETHAITYPVVNNDLAPPRPTKVARVKAARRIFSSADLTPPSLTLTKIAVEGFELAELVLKSRNGVITTEMTSLASLIDPAPRLTAIDTEARHHA